eukprot:UN13541
MENKKSHETLRRNVSGQKSFTCLMYTCSKLVPSKIEFDHLGHF